MDSLLNVYFIILEALSSDEDDIDELGPSYYERLAGYTNKKGAEHGFEVTATIKDEDEDDDSDPDDDSSDELDETALESYSTPLDDDDKPETVDEYITFQQVMTQLSTQDPGWYNMLTSGMTPEQAKNLTEVMVLADQKKAQKHSKQLENSGGEL